MIAILAESEAANREVERVNGSAPDLKNVARWFILDVDGKGPTLYFSDLWLEAGEPAAGLPALPGIRTPLYLMQ